MTNDPFFNNVLIGVFIAAALFTIVLFITTAPYGKQERDGWGPGIPIRWGWFLLEFPSFAVFAWFYLNSDHRFSAVPLVLFILWEIHYVHRTFIYPLRLRAKPGAQEKIIILLFGIIFNASNGYLNGLYIGQYAEHLYSNSWFSDPRFILGILLFAGGFALTKHSDALLRNLRKPGETGYKIPVGGAFRWVSCPNYLGEIIQWGGFALASWSLAGLAFMAFTAANLIPRAISNHKWYLEKFEQYPKERKSVIPFIL
ncbi:MAG: DUF1295 domain-containing protein [Pseudomonadales bacterium]|nr:DUF1295 domain-containing protein [Pseudomonadales bacterium]